MPLARQSGPAQAPRLEDDRGLRQHALVRMDSDAGPL